MNKTIYSDYCYACLLGYKILEAWKKDKSWILGTGNPLYPRDGPPSGTTPAGVMLQIRESIWKSEHWSKRFIAIKQSIYRKNQTSSEAKKTSEQIEEEAREDLEAEKQVTEKQGS